MGNYRFKLSDMIPNAWFYKLKEMNMPSRDPNTSTSTKKSLNPSKTKASTMATPLPSPPRQALLPNRPSYYFPSREEKKHKLSHSPVHPKASDTHFPRDPSRKSNKLSLKRKPIKPPAANLIVSSVSPMHAIRSNDEHMINKNSEFGGLDAWPEPCSCMVTSPSSDIVIEIDSRSSSLTEEFSKSDDHDAITKLKLPPILVKPAKKEEKVRESDQRPSFGNSIQKQNNKGHSYRSQTRVAAAMAQSKGISESFAVVKFSSNPHKDFRDSMLEMILENNIRSPNDLENLLARYLSLNSDEYHELIVEEFEQLWLDLASIRM